MGIKEGEFDKVGNCGNMFLFVGFMVWDKGMILYERVVVVVEMDEKGVKWVRLRMFNINIFKVFEFKFRVEGEFLRYCLRGDYVMDGVLGIGLKIMLSFLDFVGVKIGKVLLMGNFIDIVIFFDGRMIEVFFVDVSNLGVFV